MAKITRLGRHILMQGDCTNSDDVQELLAYAEKKPELLLTSPPYSDMREYGGGLDLQPEHLAKFVINFAGKVEYIAVNLGIKRKDLRIIPYWDAYIDAAEKTGIKLMSWNVWNKMTCSIGNSNTCMFPIIHEFVFVFGDKLKETNRIVLREARETQQGETNRLRQSDGTLKTLKRNSSDSAYKRLESVLICASAVTPEERQHPAAFSVKFAEAYILAMTNENDVIVDCFGGSGTTLVACEKHNRQCLLMEINEEYCDIIKRRYESWTQQLKLL